MKFKAKKLLVKNLPHPSTAGSLVELTLLPISLRPCAYFNI